ncbi:MAG: RsmE family RNA methyltransferase [Kiritimatiellia bacterium]
MRHRYYIETTRLLAPSLTLAREDARHLQTVLRVTDGETVELFDGRGQTAVARVVAAGRTGLRLERLAPPVCHEPRACQIVLFACISKGKRMDWTIEKGVELGVSRIVPVISDRTIVRLDEEEAGEKVSRWTRVAVEACRQSGAAWLPVIDTPMPLAETGPLVRACAPIFVAALVPEALPMRQVLANFRARNTIICHAGWFVGPEGDFTPEELQLLLANGAIPVSLGRQVLRAETAAIWGLCVLGAEWL